jgi:hypothetical protein
VGVGYLALPAFTGCERLRSGDALSLCIAYRRSKTIPWINTKTEQRKRALDEARRKEAAEAVAPWNRHYKPEPLETMPIVFHHVQVTQWELGLWQHIDHGEENLTYGRPCEQTDEQLAETFAPGLRSPQEIARLIESLVQKGLLRIETGQPSRSALLETRSREERLNGRYLNTTTPRTCGL